MVTQVRFVFPRRASFLVSGFWDLNKDLGVGHSNRVLIMIVLSERPDLLLSTEKC